VLDLALDATQALRSASSRHPPIRRHRRRRSPASTSPRTFLDHGITAFL
jgi:hypothetical protein